MKKKTKVVIGVILAIVLVIVGYFVVADFGSVDDYVSPQMHAVIKHIPSNDWQPVMLYRDSAGAETTSTFVFDSAFYNKEIVNDGNSYSAVMIRIIDTNGNIVIDNLEIQPGQTASLKQLDDKTEYRIEAKITGETVILNIF